MDKDVKEKDIALKSDIPPSSLSTIIKDRDKLQNYDSSNSCSKRLRTCVYEDVDEAVLKRIHTMRDKNVPISGPFVIEKTLQFSKALEYEQFLGSNGWQEKFKKRHGIVAKVQSGESKDVDDNAKDQGVIKKKFKVHYRERILRKVITALETNQSMPNINLRESISEISKAWNYDVTDRTIHNSFDKTGFFVCCESTEDEDDIPLEEMKKYGFS
ncbi:tigger transposable element-derived protein 4 [Nephila pilipes]|uniref:Tigger transposable element-derived protein 4 n=1 Tax=Nephila pilipes TaxID=299642 RepID=A0A8X6TRH3_NEPPI|nr:tigger transposable element-derived protein 4 [Nephila pilipes]GFT47933.1 tigger transposable element-derived protein 4 [Nephila pilipes]